MASAAVDWSLDYGHHRGIVRRRSSPEGRLPASWRKRLERDWVQVENTRMKGWINSQFVALKSCNKVDLPWSRC